MRENDLEEKLNSLILESIALHALFFKALTRDKTSLANIIAEYENWYSSAYIIIQNYLPERETDFKKSYEHIFSGINLARYASSGGSIPTSEFAIEANAITARARSSFQSQTAILESLPNALEIKALRLDKLISAEIFSDEIEQANEFFDKGYIRAAGVVAGVALERYLNNLVRDNMKICESEKRLTIVPLAQKLKEMELIDAEEVKKLTWLSGIRNQCAHDTGPAPKKETVKDLIDHVQRLINSENPPGNAPINSQT